MENVQGSGSEKFSKLLESFGNYQQNRMVLESSNRQLEIAIRHKELTVLKISEENKELQEKEFELKNTLAAIDEEIKSISQEIQFERDSRSSIEIALTEYEKDAKLIEDKMKSDNYQFAKIMEEKCFNYAKERKIFREYFICDKTPKADESSLGTKKSCAADDTMMDST